MEITKRFVYLETDPLDDVEEYLQGHIFHVTKLVYLPSILECGEILPNRDGRLPTTFGTSSNAFFRNRNCVSLFDYRPAPSEEINDFRKRCYPFSPATSDLIGIAILILHPKAYEALIPWTQWKEEEAWSEVVVPYVEVGYPGPIPLRLLEEGISLEIVEDPNSIAAHFRQIRENTG